LAIKESGIGGSVTTVINTARIPHNESVLTAEAINEDPGGSRRWRVGTAEIVNLGGGARIYRNTIASATLNSLSIVDDYERIAARGRSTAVLLGGILWISDSISSRTAVLEGLSGSGCVRGSCTGATARYDLVAAIANNRSSRAAIGCRNRDYARWIGGGVTSWGLNKGSGGIDCSSICGGNTANVGFGSCADVVGWTTVAFTNVNTTRSSDGSTVSCTSTSIVCQGTGRATTTELGGVIYFHVLRVSTATESCAGAMSCR